MPLIHKKEKQKILLIMLEFMEWARGRAWGYTGNFAIEEGLNANDVECVIIPVIHEIPTDSPGSWLKYARTILSGQTFDQVWVWLVHTDYDPTFWEWIDTLAPIKVGWLGESLDYLPAEIAETPMLGERKQFVTNQIKHMTHILAVDERDADYVNKNTLAKAIWIPMALPERTVTRSIIPPQHNTAVFYGSVYGERGKWLKRIDLNGLISNPEAPENTTDLPSCFTRLNAAGTECATNGLATLETLEKYVSALRSIRTSIFDIWMNELTKWLAVINLPSFGKVYTSRVQETMAAGRPVISWEIPDRPRNRALFENNKEILLYSKNNPGELAEHILRIQREPEFAEYVATNARNKMLEYHTMEKRVAQILKWIDDGTEPNYGDREKDGNQTMQKSTDAYYSDLFINNEYRSNPNPNDEEYARWTALSRMLDVVIKMIGNEKTLRILDVGCGRGWLTNLLTGYGYAEGVDPVEAVIQYARSLFPNIKFTAGSTHTVLQSEGFEPFDIIVCSEVIEHVPYSGQQEFVTNLTKLLGKSGYIVMTTPRAEIYDAWMQHTNFNLQPVDDWLTEGMVQTLFAQAGCYGLAKSKVYFDRANGSFLCDLPTQDNARYVALYQASLFRKAF